MLLLQLEWILLKLGTGGHGLPVNPVGAEAGWSQRKQLWMASQHLAAEQQQENKQTQPRLPRTGVGVTTTSSHSGSRAARCGLSMEKRHF